mmetsp:Transcript_122027/g.243014  ORF Transcript_122027/g.243014 Transcript_122027/m.243014 type:complete len:93 (+) Transcript_122027:86-364(+)
MAPLVALPEAGVMTQPMGEVSVTGKTLEWPVGAWVVAVMLVETGICMMGTTVGAHLCCSVHSLCADVSWNGCAVAGVRARPKCLFHFPVGVS